MPVRRSLPPGSVFINRHRLRIVRDVAFRGYRRNLDDAIGDWTSGGWSHILKFIKRLKRVFGEREIISLTG